MKLVDQYLSNELTKSKLNYKYHPISNSLKIKLAYKEFIKSILEGSNTILTFTLTFNNEYRVSIVQAEKDARHFKNTLDKEVFGKSNNRWRDRHSGCLVVEGNDYKDEMVNTHIHGILGFNINDVSACKKLIRKHWSRIIKAGFIIEIKEWDHREEWINYLLKQATKDVPYYDAIAVLDRSRCSGNLFCSKYV